MIEFENICKKYLSIFRIRFINSIQYRAVFIGTVLKQFAFGFMEIMAYQALYDTDPTAFPMSFVQIVSYVWIQAIFLILFRVVFSDGEIYDAISSGAVAYDLVRPVDLYGRWFCQSAANRLSCTVTQCMPLFFLALLVPAPYRLSLQISPARMILFLLSVALAFLVVVAFAMLMYISLFYIISQRGIRIIVTAVTTFFSGGVIPLSFFPENVLRTVRLLPFAAMQNMPLEIYCGNLNGGEAVRGVLFQICWLLALLLIGKLSMRRALGRVTVQGG